MIDVSKYCDGQGPFKNGMHDRCGRIRKTDNLYRRGPGTAWQRLMWRMGWTFQNLTSLGFVKNLTGMWDKP